MDRSPHPRLLAWRKDDPADPGRPSPNDPDVRRLVADIAPGAQRTDLGGVMSLNVRLDPAGLVLRVHQPFVSRPRLLALQEVRWRLADQGLIVPVPLLWRGSTVFRCRNRWAELEEYIPNERPEPTLDSSSWMFRAMATLHRALAGLALTVPRPFVATYGPPGTLRRWLPITASAVRDDPEARDIARLLRDLVRRLQRQWVPATELPMQLVHGDVRLSNARRTPEGEPVYLDFGFLAHRPRIHELAYALAFMVLRPDSHGTAEGFAPKARLLTYFMRPFSTGAGEVTRGVLLAAAAPPASDPTVPLPSDRAGVAGGAGHTTARRTCPRAARRSRWRPGRRRARPRR